jgi:hypothetical protein
MGTDWHESRNYNLIIHDNIWHNGYAVSPSGGHRSMFTVTTEMDLNNDGFVNVSMRNIFESRIGIYSSANCIPNISAGYSASWTIWDTLMSSAISNSYNSSSPSPDLFLNLIVGRTYGIDGDMIIWGIANPAVVDATQIAFLEYVLEGVSSLELTSVEPTITPEPSTMLLLGGGLAGLAFWRKRKSAK